MRKTSVYLTEEEADALRDAALATGVSQSDLIRRGITLVLGAGGKPRRTFHSMGAGKGDGRRARSWTSEELYEKTRGRR